MPEVAELARGTARIHTKVGLPESHKFATAPNSFQVSPVKRQRKEEAWWGWR